MRARRSLHADAEACEAYQKKKGTAPGWEAMPRFVELRLGDGAYQLIWPLVDWKVKVFVPPVGEAVRPYCVASGVGPPVLTDTAVL